MMDNVKKVTNKRMKDLKEIEKDMAHVTKVYNKKAIRKAFQVGDMVWKTTLTLGIEKQIWQVVSKLGRTIHQVVFRDLCMMETPRKSCLPRALNGRYI
jgi:hypothetical protein